MSTFDIKKFLINEGMTRVSRDRKRLLKEEYDRGEIQVIVQTAMGSVLASKLPADQINAKYGDEYLAIPADKGWSVEALDGEGEIVVPESELDKFISFVIDKDDFEAAAGMEPTKKDAELEYSYFATGTWED